MWMSVQHKHTRLCMMESWIRTHPLPTSVPVSGCCSGDFFHLRPTPHTSKKTVTHSPQDIQSRS